MRLVQQLRSYDWVLLASTFLLLTVGTAVIFSIDVARATDGANGKRQLIAIAIGLVVLTVAAFAADTFYRATGPWWYLIGVVLLGLVLVIGTTIRGTQGWFQIGGFSFQPVEFMKVALVLMMAKFVERRRADVKRFSFFVGSAAVVAVPMALVLLQPDLGSALLLGLFWFGMMLVLRVRMRYVLGLLALGAVFSAVAWFFVLQPYQKDRLITFVNPEHDPLGAGYNITQSIIAVGSGRWFGRGLGFGSQSQLRFLPESHTDFIFAVIAEAFGLVGSMVILGIFALIAYRLTRMMLLAHDDFSLLVITGALVMLAAQWIVNVGATIGLLPVTGVPLPLLSYGGSAIVSTLLLFGIVESMYAARRGEY